MTTEKENLFKSLNSFFDHVYILTLKGSKNRHSHFQEELDGLDYEMFWAVNGHELNLDEISENGIYDPELSKEKYPIGKDLVPGEIGCALSHLEIYRDILKNGYEKVLILEDDIVVDQGTLNRFDQSLSELPKDWEVLYLGCYHCTELTYQIKLRIWFAYPLLKLFGFKKFDARKLQEMYPKPFSKNLDIAGQHFGTYAYGVTAAGAERILKAQTPICMASDNAIGMMSVDNTIKALNMKHHPFYQSNDFSSTIEGRV